MPHLLLLMLQVPAAPTSSLKSATKRSSARSTPLASPSLPGTRTGLVIMVWRAGPAQAVRQVVNSNRTPCGPTRRYGPCRGQSEGTTKPRARAQRQQMYAVAAAAVVAAVLVAVDVAAVGGACGWAHQIASAARPRSEEDDHFRQQHPLPRWAQAGPAGSPGSQPGAPRPAPRRLPPQIGSNTDGGGSTGAADWRAGGAPAALRRSLRLASGLGRARVDRAE